MRLIRSIIGLFLLVLVTCPLITRSAANLLTEHSVFAEVLDINNDNINDLIFRITNNEGYGESGIHINVTLTNAQNYEPLLSGATNSTGYCIFYNPPSGNYSWKTSDGTPNSGILHVPIKQYAAFSEKETIVIQFLLLTWMGNQTEKTKTFYQNFSRYVGYDLEKHPFPSVSGKNLSTFSRELFRWNQGLENCIVTNISDPEVSQLLQKILGVSKEVCARIHDISLSQHMSDNITEVRLLFKGLVENPAEINFTVNYYQGNNQLTDYTVLRMSTSNEKTTTALFGILTSSFDPFIEFHPYDQVEWRVGAQSGNLLIGTLVALEMTTDILDNYVKPILEFARMFPETAAGLYASLGKACLALTAFTLGVVSILLLTNEYPTWESYINSLFRGEFAALFLTTLAVASLTIAILIVAGAISSTGIGIVVGAILTAFAFLIDWYYYVDWIDDLTGILGQSLTEMFRIRQAMYSINTTLVRESAEDYKEASNLLGKFAIASPRMIDFFTSSKNRLWNFGVSEGELANAVEEARQALDDLIRDYLYWESETGKVQAHLKGFYSTLANYTNTMSFVNSAGVFYPTKGYKRKYITHYNLDPSPQYKASEHYMNWANHPQRESDPSGNPFTVIYNNDTGEFTYSPQPSYFSEENVKNVTRNGSLETFYQYKFFFDAGTTRYNFWWWEPNCDPRRNGLPVEAVLIEWRNHLEEKYENDVEPKILRIFEVLENRTRDTDPPRTVLYVHNVQGVDFLHGKVYVNSSTVFTLTTTDEGSGVEAIRYRIFNNATSMEWRTRVGPNTHTASFILPQSLENGGYNIEYKSIDHAGNIESTSSFAWVFVGMNWLPLPFLSPTFVVARPKLGVTPMNISTEIFGGENATTTVTISELTGEVDLQNVLLTGSNLTGVNNATIRGYWSFSNNSFNVPKGGSVNITATLTLCMQASMVGDYCGMIEIESNDGSGYIFIKVTVNPLPAVVEIDPSALNLFSQGRWMTCHVELPEGYNIEDVDFSSIMINNTIPLDFSASINLENDDVTSDLRLVFNRTQIVEHILSNGMSFGNVTLTITGDLCTRAETTSFGGSEVVSVSSLIADVNCDGKVNIFDLISALSSFSLGEEDFGWNPNANFAPLWDTIDIFDLVTIAFHYGEAY